MMGARGSPSDRLYATETYAESWAYSGRSFGEVERGFQQQR